MRIHSSSLTLTPAGLNRTVGNGDDALKKNERERSAATEAQNYNQPSSPEEIKQTLENTGSNLELSNRGTINEPTDLRTIKALSAYSRAFNVPQQEQRAELITGIDVYA